MKALIILSPISKREVILKKVDKYVENFNENPVNECKKKYNEISSTVSEIVLLPTYVDTVEFVKDELDMSPLSMLKPNMRIGDEGYEYLKFTNSTKIKIGGRIVSFNLDEGKNKKKSQEEGTKNNSASGTAANIQMSAMATASSVLDDEETAISSNEPAFKRKGLIDVVQNYSKMGSNEKKRIRQVAGKKLIEYLSNLAAINQITKWAVQDDKVPDRNPSEPIRAYRNLTKSLLILYFKDDKVSEKKEIESEKDAQERYEYAEIKTRLDTLNGEIKDYNDKILGLLKTGKDDELTLTNIQKYREKQKILLEEKERIKKEKLNGQANYEAYRKQEDIKQWTESLLGIELGVPFRFMYVPEVEILKYLETYELTEKSEGRFEILLKQSLAREQYVEVGSAITLAKKGAMKVWDGISSIFSGNKNENP
ncbi:hypothetical protein [Leptotrichia sp. oral taxon 417]|jgi:hypothetical protein|uniref:hypothetical protein n=1 Tax=Leptotrichia sp. oral taxon 417 TaxID=712365 RepID=UPI0015B82E5B|nr:hypothetical protein [Leptotrichia sp. oral taxon 417]NWO27988.1 hypothetical protein [Leptotrichia sp. oral taxon 417]